MRPSEALQRHRLEIREIVARHGVRNVRIFGSVLHGDDTDESDLDLLVDVPKGTTLLDMVRLQTAIEDIVGVRVDVITALDLPEKLRSRVLAEAKAL